ncbi:MAG: site-specific DNA-methyltransferase [Chitinophagales bacterium]
MAKKVESIKHKGDKRAHIPSKEEAGYEDANAKVQDGKKVLELSKNPVVHRGQDPELFWLNKYGNDDRDDLLRVDIRSLYRHEHIAPETLIKNLYNVTETKSDQMDLFSVNELFGNALDIDEIEKVSEYYQHQDGWTNRLIQGDSHLVMASLLEREGMAGQVQTIFFDPPYGIKYGSNWQIKLNNRDVKDGSDEMLSGEPEQIKAFRDTWELGIHSYLGYLRDRLLIAKELLKESGSCFIQISDENVHLVRNIMDEVFVSENFVTLITFRKKTMQFGAKHMEGMSDYLLLYAKNKDSMKYRPLYTNQNVQGQPNWNFVKLPDGNERKLTNEEWENHSLLPKDSKIFRPVLMRPSGFSEKMVYDVEFKGKTYKPAKNGCWSTTFEGMKKLISNDRVFAAGDNLYYKLFHSDYPVSTLTNLWADMSGPKDIQYVVQTLNTVVQRCIIMTSDPGDLVLDPTCGSGTSAFVAEQFGRRWITIDTSRIAINIAKQRVMTAIFPYYKLYDENEADIRQGFINRLDI